MYVGIDWLIVGGESGAKARPMHPEWAEVLAVHAAAAGIPFHFKQWGTWAPWGNRGEPIAMNDAGLVRTSQASWAEGDTILRRTQRSPEQEYFHGTKHQAWPPYQRAML